MSVPEPSWGPGGFTVTGGCRAAGRTAPRPARGFRVGVVGHVTSVLP